MRNDFDGAAAHFQKAVELDPLNAMAHQTLAQMLLAKGDMEGAAACCEKALALDPQCVPAFLTLCMARNYQGEYELARSAALAALERLPPEEANYRPQAQQLLEANNALLAQDKQVTTILKRNGGAVPAERAHPLLFADMCRNMKRYPDAVRFYAAALSSAEPVIYTAPGQGVALPGGHNRRAGWNGARPRRQVAPRTGTGQASPPGAGVAPGGPGLVGNGAAADTDSGRAARGHHKRWGHGKAVSLAGAVSLAAGCQPGLGPGREQTGQVAHGRAAGLEAVLVRRGRFHEKDQGGLYELGGSRLPHERGTPAGARRENDGREVLCPRPARQKRQPELRLEDAQGKTLTTGKDDGNHVTRIVFTASRDDTYRIVVAASQLTDPRMYHLLIRETGSGFTPAKPGPSEVQAPAGETPVQRAWWGTQLDDSLEKLKPKSGVIVDQDKFAKLWKAWMKDERIPVVDFTKQFVAVVSSRMRRPPHYPPSLSTLSGTDLSLSPVAGTEKLEKGFAYEIQVIEKELASRHLTASRCRRSETQFLAWFRPR